MEEWKFIPESEGRYSVSNLGRVRREAYSLDFGKGIRVYQERELIPFIQNGYNWFSITVKNKNYKFYVHRIVATLFLPNPSGLRYVNHKNLNKLDSRLDNLEWVSQSDNLKHYHKRIKCHQKRKITKSPMVSGDGEIFVKHDLLPFMVSNIGRVYDIGRGGFCLEHKMGGYSVVSKNGKEYSIHRLVCSVYIPNPYNHPIINHKDGNKLNNKADNLEWCTHSHNSRHAANNGLKKILGEMNVNSKLSDLEAEEIIKMHQNGVSCKDIALEFGMSVSHIYKIANKKARNHKQVNHV